MGWLNDFSMALKAWNRLFGGLLRVTGGALGISCLQVLLGWNIGWRISQWDTKSGKALSINSNNWKLSELRPFCSWTCCKTGRFGPLLEHLASRGSCKIQHGNLFRISQLDIMAGFTAFGWLNPLETHEVTMVHFGQLTAVLAPNWAGLNLYSLNLIETAKTSFPSLFSICYHHFWW